MAHADPPAPRGAALALDMPDTVEGALRRAESICALVAVFELCDDEPVPPSREGAADVLLEAAALVAAVRASLPASSLNLEVSLRP